MSFDSTYDKEFNDNNFNKVKNMIAEVAVKFFGIENVVNPKL